MIQLRGRNCDMTETSLWIFDWCLTSILWPVSSTNGPSYKYFRSSEGIVQPFRIWCFLGKPAMGTSSCLMASSKGIISEVAHLFEDHQYKSETLCFFLQNRSINFDQPSSEMCFISDVFASMYQCPSKDLMPLSLFRNSDGVGLLMWCHITPASARRQKWQDFCDSKRRDAFGWDIDPLLHTPYC